MTSVRIDGVIAFWRVANQDLDEKPLQCHSEGGNGREGMSFEGFSQMSQREFGRTVRYYLGWRAQARQRCSDGDLSFGKSPPDMIGGGIAQSAIEISKGLQFVSRFYSGIEKLPQILG